jgi:hypothetical protein
MKAHCIVLASLICIYIYAYVFFIRQSIYLSNFMSITLRTCLKYFCNIHAHIYIICIFMFYICIYNNTKQDGAGKLPQKHIHIIEIFLGCNTNFGRYGTPLQVTFRWPRWPEKHPENSPLLQPFASKKDSCWNPKMMEVLEILKHLLYYFKNHKIICSIYSILMIFLHLVAGVFF